MYLKTQLLFKITVNLFNLTRIPFKKINIKNQI